MEVTTEVVQQVKSMEKVLAEYLNYQVTTTEENQQAADDLKQIKVKAKELDELRRSMTKPLDDAKARIMDFFRRPTEMLTSAEKSIKAAMSSYFVEEQRKLARQREEQQRLLDIENEKRRKILEEEAKAALVKGDEAAALDALVEVERLPQEIKVPEAPKPSGISYRTVWKFRVVDATALPEHLKMPNEKMIAAQVASTKGDTKISGVEVFSEQIVASR